MSIEDFNLMPPHFAHTPEVVRLYELEQHLSGEYIEIADTGTAGDLHELAHGLDRVPTGIILVQVVAPAAFSPGAAGWYRLETDDPWTRESISLRFSADNLRVLLRVI